MTPLEPVRGAYPSLAQPIETRRPTASRRRPDRPRQGPAIMPARPQPGRDREVGRIGRQTARVGMSERHEMLHARSPRPIGTLRAPIRH
jgi:hypothetical protein